LFLQRGGGVVPDVRGFRSLDLSGRVACWLGFALRAWGGDYVKVRCRFRWR
jgi:hypothetical protein